MCWLWLETLFAERSGRSEMSVYSYDLGNGYVGQPPVTDITPDLVPKKVVVDVVGDDHTVGLFDEVVVFSGTGSRQGNIYLPIPTGSSRQIVITNAGVSRLVVDAGVNYTINDRQTQTLHRGSSMTIIDRASLLSLSSPIVAVVA